MLSLVALIAAFILFLIAAFANPVDPWRGKLCCIAFACWIGAEILSRVPLLK